MSVKTSHTQTEEPFSSENSCQIPKRQNAKIQTEEQDSNDEIFADYNVDSLINFLRRVSPMVCSVLEKNSKSKAFDRYKSSTSSTESTISCLHILEKSLIAEEKFCCSNISWNCVGTALAASYSYLDHMSWCEHDSSVNIWSLNRKDFDPKKPYLSLETDCCVTYVSFHPKLPAIIAAGKLNGEVLLWDISKEDDPLLSSTETALSNHREPITGIHWILQYGKHSKIDVIM